MVKISKKNVLLLVLVSFIITNGKTWSGAARRKTTPPFTSPDKTSPVNTSSPITGQSVETAISNEKQTPTKNGKTRRYTYILSEEKVNNADEYSRKEIESFLSACIPGFIRVEDLYRIGGKYFVKAMEMNTNQQMMSDGALINKWFEDQVTVTSKGKLTVVDIDTITGFFKKINQVIGREKFVYRSGIEAANIIIELAPPGKSLHLEMYAGETSLLQDNLKVRIITSDQNMEPHIETYNSGNGMRISESLSIKFYPQELEFMKNNRLVKVYMKNILDPNIRYFAFIHELLHSIGFTGHSPYDDSHLYPLPVQAYPGYLPGVINNRPIISELAERMVEILYRPEILPGMTVKEARDVLTRLKRINKCSKNEITSYLLVRKERLENQKNTLLEKEKEKYRQRMKTYIEMDKKEMKEQWYLEELEEIRADYGLSARVVNDIRSETTKLKKLIRIRQELIFAKVQKKRWLEKSPVLKGTKDAGVARRELKRLEEEIIVLTDLLKVEEEISALEGHILAAVTSNSQRQVQEKLQRIVRQIFTIDRELQVKK